MFLQPNFNVSRFVTLGIVLLLLIAMVDMGPIAYSEEVEQKPQETINAVISEIVDPEPSESIEEIIVYGQVGYNFSIAAKKS